MPEQGWWIPRFANGNHKWHYYDKNGKSLCGRYTKFLGLFAEDADDPKYDEADDNCVVCWRKVKKVREAASDNS